VGVKPPITSGSNPGASGGETITIYRGTGSLNYRAAVSCRLIGQLGFELRWSL
jgi:hypothetical protein